jgi:glucokinase
MTAHSSSDRVFLGVDIGGTKVALGLVDAGGKILTQSRRPMIANGTAEMGLQAVVDAIDSMTAQAVAAGKQVQAIGICAPGPLDPVAGVILNPPNVTCWRNFPLAARIADKYTLPVKVDNDANAAALAETRWGAAQGYRHVFYTTVGTGIGTGIVLDGKIYHGNTGSAGEGGHVSIDYNGPVCGCGKRGCIEALAAGTAIGLRARAKLADLQSPHSTLLDLAGGDLARVTSEMVGKAYEAGDPLAREVLEDTVKMLSAWLGNIVDLFDPDVLVMGGGVAGMLRPFFGAIKNYLPTWCVNPHVGKIPLLMAHYGADAGIAGGAALCA